MNTSPIDYWYLQAELRQAVRRFFQDRRYLELETPIAVSLPGTEVYLRYFETAWIDHAGQKQKLWLRSSPEIHLKKAIAAGVPRVFELARCFRNHGELANWHHPEFTMLEWYETAISFDDYIDQTEALLRFTLEQLTPVIKKKHASPTLQLPEKIDRISVKDAFYNFLKIDLFDGDPDLAQKAIAAGIISVKREDDFETAFFKVLLDGVEPQLAKIGAAVLIDYPPSQAALAKVRDGVAKRFEFYINGIELCNGFEELLDLEENKKRIRDSLKRRAELGFETPGEDLDFYSALDQGMPACCGNALGLDRWLALLLCENSIDRVISFRNIT